MPGQQTAIGTSVCFWALSFSLGLGFCASAMAASARGPVAIIGVDGMTFDVIDPMVKAGRLPEIKRLLRTGSRGVLLSEKPMRSPALWTTIATGQPRDKHQIYDFVTGSGYWPQTMRGDKQRLVTSDMRQSDALWGFAGEVGKRSLIVGWLNTWPAEEVNGVMFAPYVALNELRQTSIKGRIYRDAEEQSHPPELFASMVDLVVATDEVAAKRVRALAQVPDEGSHLYKKLPFLDRYMFSLRWSIASTLTNTRILEATVARKKPFDLVMTYFDGADTLAHRFWILRESEERIRARLKAHGFDEALAPELKKRFGLVLEGYYILVDEMLGRIRKALGSQATIILVSDHGWGSSEGDAARHATVPFDGEHRLEGVFVASGPAIKKGTVKPLTHYDIAPTALYLMGVQPPEELPGQIVVEAIAKKRLDKQRAEKGKRKPPQGAKKVRVIREAPHSDEEIERLRSLGYVE